MIRKLKQQQGETLVETLVSLLIATLSVMLLTAAITASARINKQNKEADKIYAEELKRVESYEATADNPMQNKSIKIDFGNGIVVEKEIELYGGMQGKFASYKAKEDDGP